MKEQRLICADGFRGLALLCALLIAVTVFVACNSPPEAISAPAATDHDVLATTTPPNSASIVEPVTDIVSTAVLTPASFVTTSVITSSGTDFSALSGTWASEDDFTPIIEIAANGAFTSTYNYADFFDTDAELPSLVFPDVISVADGQYLVDAPATTSLVLHGNLLLVDGYFDYVMHRIGSDGSSQPYQPINATELPSIDSGTVISVAIVDSWTGLSPLAPVESHYALNTGPKGLEGTAFFSVAGYVDPITATTPISVPLAAWHEALDALTGTPLESGPYRPVFSIVDHYPRLAMVIKTVDQEFRFDSTSQGVAYVPWRVVVNGQDYVSYSDYPAQALQVLEPYLARPVLEELKNQAWP